VYKITYSKEDPYFKSNSYQITKEEGGTHRLKITTSEETEDVLRIYSSDS
jgi:hypothetical protein